MKAINENEYVSSGANVAHTQTQLVSAFWVKAYIGYVADVDKLAHFSPTLKER